ncbi:SCO family protein, partial [Methylogaea oryzae]|uniref:SCO family protein n=1 Tax=Methylogaea oryzae TaxID=1295382 RepID=UPI00138F3295
MSMKYWIFGLALILAAGHAAANPLPPPGSYSLPPIKQAADGEVLDEQGRALRLRSLLDGKITLLSFIYSACNDAKGCPLATQVLHQVGKRLGKEPDVAGKLRLITLSFNPQQDTPAAMARYGEHLKRGLDWHFLTTSGETALRPILDAYGQAAERLRDKQGRETEAFAHLLRVYLIDGRSRVRNMYDLSTLQADLLVNDVRTLLSEEASTPPATNSDCAAPLCGKALPATTLLGWAK